MAAGRGPRHVAVPLAGGAGLGAGLAGAGPPDPAFRQGQARLHHRLRQRLRQPAGAAAGPPGLPGAGRLPDPERGRQPPAGLLLRPPPHHPARRHPLRQHPPGRRVGAGRGGRERSLWASEQRGGGQPHRPHGVDGDGGLPPGHGRQRLRGHRGDAPVPAAAEAGAGPGGEHLQRAGPPLRQRRRLLHLQVLHRGLLGQPAARHVPLRGEGQHRGARLLQDGGDQPGEHRGVPAPALGAPGARDAAQLRRGFLPQVPQGAAPHHERHLRRRPRQGDPLHGARAERPAPAHPLQRRLGRQAALAACLLPARLPRRLRPGHHPAQAGPPRPLVPRCGHQSPPRAASPPPTLQINCPSRVLCKRLPAALVPVAAPGPDGVPERLGDRWWRCRGIQSPQPCCNWGGGWGAGGFQGHGPQGDPRRCCHRRCCSASPGRARRPVDVAPSPAGAPAAPQHRGCPRQSHTCRPRCSHCSQWDQSPPGGEAPVAGRGNTQGPYSTQ